MADGRELHHLSAAAQRGERIHVLGAADLVLLALQGDPGLSEALPGLNDDFALLARGVVQAGPGAEHGAAKVLVGAEAQADGALEGAGRRLHQRGVHHRRSGRVTDEDRNAVLGQAKILLNPMTEGLEVGGERGAGGIGLQSGGAQGGQVPEDVDADDHGAVVPERLSHPGYADLPAPVPRQKDRDAPGGAIGYVDRRGAEAPRGH